MADTLRIKRRPATGSAGAPVALKTAELAFNDNDGKLYIGRGDDGAANATSVAVIAGSDHESRIAALESQLASLTSSKAFQ